MTGDQKEVFKAWIDGETIQYLSYSREWLDCRSFEDSDLIQFVTADTYRIKPKNIVLSTFIQKDNCGGFQTINSRELFPHNLRMTFSPDGKLLKAEVI